MKKKFIILLLLTMLFTPMTVKAWQGYNSGQKSSAQGCDTATTGWCMWDNKHFSLAKVSVWFYNNGQPQFQYGKTVLFYNDSNGSLSSNDRLSASQNTGVYDVYRASYWPTSSEDYSTIDYILRDNDYNLRDLLSQIHPNGYEDLKNRVETKNPGETLGIGYAQGYRIIIEPVFKIMANSQNKSTPEGTIVVDTLRNILSDPNVLTENSRKAFGKKLFVLVSDVYDAVDCNNEYYKPNRLAEHSGPGCSIGVYAPFDNVDGPPPTNECKEKATFNGCSNGTIEDPTFSCILVKERETSDYYVASNRFCQVACRDEMTYIYPNASGIRSVLQGGFMTIGDNDFSNVKGAVSIGQVQIRNTRTCRVTGKDDKEQGLINESKFYTAKSNAYIGLNAAYENVRSEEARRWRVHNLYTVGQIANSYNESDTPECKDYYTDRKRYEDEYDSKYNTPEYNDPKNPNYKEKPDKNSYVSDRLQNPDCKTHYTQRTYSIEGLSSSVQYEKNGYNPEKAFNEIKSAADSALASAKTSANDATRAYTSVINEWNACSDGSILNSIDNDLNGSTVVLDYSNIDKNGNVVYKYEDTSLAAQQMVEENSDIKYYGKDTNATAESLPFNSIGYNKNQVSDAFHYYDSAGNAQADQQISFGNNVGWWQKSQTVRISFNIPQTGYRYKTIPDGLYTINKPNANNHVDLGEGVMPTSMSTPRGRTYNFNLQITALGPVLNKKYSKYLPNTATQCKYKVDCDDYIMDSSNHALCRETIDTYCGDGTTPVPCGDITIIYRTISLNEGEAFPGVNAQGRTPGDNWNDEDYVSYQDTKRYKYIYHNRGVDGYDVYNLDPMYEITLTPSVMRQYRRYNREANRRIGRTVSNNQLGTGILGYADFASMVCNVQSMGDYSCTSSLLRGGTTYGSTNLTGVSEDMMVRGCALRNGGSYNNCGDQTIVNNRAWAMNISKES